MLPMTFSSEFVPAEAWAEKAGIDIKKIPCMCSNKASMKRRTRIIFKQSDFRKVGRGKYLIKANATPIHRN